MRAVLDTSVLISSAPSTLNADEVAISAVSLAELHYGVLVTTDDITRASRLRRLSQIEHRFDALPLDHNVARSYGQVAAAVAKIGRNPRPRLADLLIAATAHAHGASLATRNAKDLRGLEDLLDIIDMG